MDSMILLFRSFPKDKTDVIHGVTNSSLLSRSEVKREEKTGIIRDITFYNLGIPLIMPLQI